MEDAIKLATTVDSGSDDEKSSEGPMDVGVRFTLQNISDINTAAQVFTARFKVKLTWFASEQDIESWENEGGKNDLEWTPPSFAPAIHWTNALSPPEMTIKDDRDRYYEVSKKADKKSGKKFVSYDFACHGTFSEAFELQSFPFDVQDLSIIMKLQNKGASSKYRFVPDFTTNEFSKFQMANSVTTEWTIHEPMLEFGFTNKTESKNGKQYSLFVAKLKMERNSGFYLSRVCVYLAMLSGLSLTAFAIGVGDVGDRLGVNFTMLLAIIAYQLVVGSLLPIVDFLTFIDKYSSFSTLIVSLITMENGVLGYIYNNADDEDLNDIENLDCVFFWIFVGLWILGQLVFTFIGQKTKNKEFAKLKMGTLALAKYNGENEETSGENYFFSNKTIDDKQRDGLNNGEWLTLIGAKK